MGKPVSYKTSAMRPVDVYGNQLKVEAVDAEGKPAGSSYVNSEDEAAAWFAKHVEAQHETPPAEAADLGATPESTHRRGRRE